MSFDFSKLKVKTTEEREREDQERENARIDETRRKRKELSKKTIDITPFEFAGRFTINGDRILTIHGKDSQNSNIRADFWFVEEIDGKINDLAEKIYSHIEAKTAIRLAGYWKKNTFKNNDDTSVESWTFQTQQIVLP